MFLFNNKVIYYKYYIVVDFIREGCNEVLVSLSNIGYY